MTTPPKNWNRRSLATRAVHAGRIEPPVENTVVTPIFQSATYQAAAEYDAAYNDIRYVRMNNTPNHAVLAGKMAALEETEAAIVCSSGMAAITTTLMTLVSSGEHIVAADTLYGGTQMWLDHDAPDFGISYSAIDLAKPATWGAAVNGKSRVLYVETISNPLIGIADLAALVTFARSHKLVTVIDNTFASPVVCQPATAGFDIVLHSATKYLNGHSDLAAGVICGRQKWLDPILTRLNHLGGTLDPHSCFLLERGLKTLTLRVNRQSETALTLARWLDQHEGVAGVNYAGLDSHPRHALATEQFRGFGGMMSFYLADSYSPAAFLGSFDVILHAWSLGGPETLCVQPSKSSHVGLTERELARLGITENLIRVSVGLEDADDLLDDFSQALKAASP